MASIADIITGAAQAHGEDSQLMMRMAQIESGLNPSAYNAGSGASGLFQFTPGTAKAYGLSNPQDPVANSNAAAQLLADNRAALTKVLGRDPTGDELYLAHQQGLGGATRLLANPDAPAASIVGTRAVLSNGGTQSMTARQYTDMWASKVAGAKPAAIGSLGQLYADGAAPPVSTNTPQPPMMTGATINPPAVMAAQLPLDDVGAPVMPQRAPTVANGGAAAAEAKRRALITGQGGLGALFA